MTLITLDFYPNCQQARAVLTAVEAVSAEAQLADLWARLENEPSGERRIPLLARLLERDKEKRDTIRKLLAEEKERRRSRLFDERLESLRGLVRQECWADCFDGVTSLMRQPEFGQRANEVLSLCPFFPVLHDNKQLQSAADRSVKDLWLRFVKTKIAFAASNAPGNTAACFEAFEELRPWFNSFPEFQDDYLVALQREQEKSRAEISTLLAQSEVPECPAGEVRRIYGCLRKRMPVLPSEERRELVRTMEERLARLIPEHDPGLLLEEYREALQIGHSEKAAYLRQEIIDSAAREAVDAEFAAAFHIDWEPLTLEFSDDLPIDLTTAPPLLIYYLAGQRILLRDGGDSFVMIDFPTKAACRMTSPIFAKTAALDSTQEGVFLFVEETGKKIYGDRLWRAELSVERAAFTAHFDMRQRFAVEDGFNVEAVLLSSERDTDYFVLIKHIEGRCPAKLMRKRLAPNATLQTLQLGNRNEFKMWRWGSCPDNFIVGAEGEMKRVNRNLSVRAGISVTPNLYKLDGPNGCIYGVEEARMTKRGTSLEFIKSFESAPCFGMYEAARVHGISFQTDTALMVMGEGRQTFYNLRNNTFSSKIRVGRVIPYYLDGKWYCFDYSKEEGKLRLRDITQEIHTRLTWRQFFFLRKNRKNMIKLMVWFNDRNNFVYQPEDWGPCEVGESAPTGDMENLLGEPAG